MERLIITLLSVVFGSWFYKILMSSFVAKLNSQIDSVNQLLSISPW